MKKDNKQILTNREPQGSFIVAINSSLDDFKNKCSLYEITPSSTFKSSITGTEVLYAVFNTDICISDLRMCYVIQGCLNKLFNSYKGIPAFKNALKKEFALYSSLVASCEKSDLQYKLDYSVLDISYLVYAACHEVARKASKGNAAYVRELFLKAINLNESSLPLTTTMKKASFQKSTFSCDAYKYILEQTHEDVEFVFNVTADDFIATLNGDKFNNICPTIAINSLDPTWDENVDVSLLIANSSPCMLLKELCTGSNKVSLSQLRFIAKSLCNVKGAQTSLKESIIKTGLYGDFVPSIIEYLMSNYRKSGYTKMSISCKDFCPHHTSCNNAFAHPIMHVEDVLVQKKGTIRRLKGIKRTAKDKDAIRAEIANQFNEDCSSEENKVYVYKCFVGLGKTRMYLEKVREFIESEKTVIIALPTHALKDDVVRRLTEEHLDEDLIASKVLIIPGIPTVDVTFERKLDAFYLVGDYSGAAKFMRDYADNLTAEKQDKKDALNSYLEAVANLKNKDYTKGKIIFTTHERLFSLNEINPDIVLIDEDITNSILRIQQVSTGELEALALKIKNTILSDDNISSAEGILGKINSILGATDKVLYSISTNTKEKSKLRSTILKAITEDKGVYYNSRIIDLLFNNCTYVKSIYKEKDKEKDVIKAEINFICRRNLSFDCKIFIMSATSDQEICQRLFRQDMVVFREFDIPKLAASITMRYDYSFSKSWFDKNKYSLSDYTEYLEKLRDYKLSKTAKHLVPRDNKNQPLIITFKDNEADFQALEFTTLMHFGNTTGTDAHKGKNVVVFGTYNLPSSAYSLYTKAIYPEEPISKVPEYSCILVENSDYSFYIWTSKESSKFRKVHLWKIESEMIQALGRARPIDENSIIKIFSNVPPAGIDITFI